MNEDTVIRIGHVDTWLDNGTSRTFTRAELEGLQRTIKWYPAYLDDATRGKLLALIDSQLGD